MEKQIVGNIGLYWVCYELSKRGWNVLPTSRNARGVDIIIYSQDNSRKLAIQVKTLSKGYPVPLGSKEENLNADFYTIHRLSDRKSFVLTNGELKERMDINNGEKGKSIWLSKKNYELFENAWDKIGKGN